MLVITGGEAMYADLGHFGARPIRVGWFAVVFPALLLNYLGQGAHLLGGAPIAAGKLFYSLAPAPLVAPLVILATLATVVASQALISGAFSLDLAGDRARAVSTFRCQTHPSRPRRTNIYSRRQLGTLSRLRRAGDRLRFVLGAGRRLWSRRGGRDADHLLRHGSNRAALLALERGANGAGVGSVHGGQRRLSRREFAKIPGGRLRAADGRRRGFPCHGDLALGAQGDLRGLCRALDHDHGGRGRAASLRNKLFSNATRSSWRRRGCAISPIARPRWSGCYGNATAFFHAISFSSRWFTPRSPISMTIAIT